MTNVTITPTSGTYYIIFQAPIRVANANRVLNLQLAKNGTAITGSLMSINYLLYLAFFLSCFAKRDDIKNLYAKKLDFQDLLKRNIIEFISAEEQENMYLCPEFDELREKKFLQYIFFLIFIIIIIVINCRYKYSILLIKI